MKNMRETSSNWLCYSTRPSVPAFLRQRNKTDNPEYIMTPAMRGHYRGVGKLDGVFEGFERTRFDHFARRLGFEHCRLFCERIDSFMSRNSRLCDRCQFQQTRNHDLMLCFELFVDQIV